MLSLFIRLAVTAGLIAVFASPIFALPTLSASGRVSALACRDINSISRDVQRSLCPPTTASTAALIARAILESRAKATTPIKPGSKKERVVAEKKDNRAAAKSQKAFQAGLKQKQQDKNPKVQAKKAQNAADKATRKAAWNAKSSADKASQQAANNAKQAATRAKHVADNTKANNSKKGQVKATATKKIKAANGKLAAQATKDYKATTGLPSRKAKYTTPQGKVYTGKDVRTAVYGSHLAEAKGGVGYNSFTGAQSKQKDKLPKDFENRPNSDGKLPLPGMKGKGREFVMLNGKQRGHDGRKPAPTDARVITQKNGAGYKLAGVVAHPAGSDDHVQVHPTR